MGPHTRARTTFGDLQHAPWVWVFIGCCPPSEPFILISPNVLIKLTVGWRYHKGGEPVPIIRLLQHDLFGPEDIKVITTAFEGALSNLGLVYRDDPLTELVAEKIIECAQTGERDTIRLRDGALKLLKG